MGIGGVDPVATGWAVSLGRPGGNITGLTASHPDVPGKALELLKEAVHGLTRVVTLYDPAAILPSSPYFETMQRVATQLGLQLRMLPISGPAELNRALHDAARWKAQALHLIESATLLDHRARLAELATQARLPGIAVLKQMAEAGFLMAYGPDIEDLHRRAAVYVVKILRGAKAGDLPFERPAKFELVINGHTVRALGLTMPSSLLLLANEVIQ